MSPAFDAGSCSERGRRDYQQDAVGHQPVAAGLIAAVADGVGSFEGSDVAAQVAVRTVLQHHFRAPGVVAGGSLRPGVEGAVADAHRQARQSLAALGKPGATTLALLLLVGGSAVVAHVGDSRVYRLRAGRLAQLTEDHRHPLYRHIIDRCLGSERGATDTTPDVLETDVQPGDVYLLTTDGVHDTLSPEQLVAVLEDAGTSELAAQALVESALASGSRDNCTALVVRVPKDAPATVRGAA